MQSFSTVTLLNGSKQQLACDKDVFCLPLLFNIFLEQIMMEALRDFNCSVDVNGLKVSNLRFADDIDLIAGSR